MTNREYVTKVVDGLGLSSDDVELILLRYKLNPEDDVNFWQCGLAIRESPMLIYKRTARKITEGGYTIEFEKGAGERFCELMYDPRR